METLYPGLYLQEKAGEQPIEGVSNSVGAFVGVTERGPVGKSQLVTSWNEFVSKYGSYINNSYLAYAVRGFFENGGSQAYISRVVHYNEGLKTSLASSGQFNDSGAQLFLIVDAKEDGTFGNNIEAEIVDYDDGSKQFTFKVYEKGQLIEKYEKVTLTTIEDIVNPESKLVSTTVIDENLVPVDGTKVQLSGGDDGLVGLTASDYVGSATTRNGLYAFDNDPINLIAIPGNTDETVIAGMVAYAENRKDCFIITEVPLAKNVTGARDYALQTTALSSERLALYFGWLSVSDPIGVGKNPVKLVPPAGHIMGVYARTDSERGVWKAPAGTEAVIRGAVGVHYNVNDNEQALLNPVGVNAIRAFAGDGLVVWGTRTMKSGEYGYVPVRRSVDYVERSILQNTRWAVFEPNDADLYEKIRTSIESFLRGYWNSGGLKGTTEEEAFYVQVDSTTTTQDDIDAGRVNANIGLAVQKPAEFIVFTVSLIVK